MGATFEVVCKTCQVRRDLDKFYPMREVCETRADALELAEEIERGHSFRAGLLATFMWKHEGHDCTVFCDENDNDFWEYTEDTNFWKEST